MEGHRFQPENSFARLVHRFDLVLETLRGGRRAKLTGGVYFNGCAGHCCPIDARNKGFCLCSGLADANRPGFTSDPSIADIDVVTAGGEISTGSIAQCNVQVTGVEKERCLTDSRVSVPV